MEELKIVINQELGIISTNFEDVKSVLTEQMQVYTELEVTVANKPERKKDIATLRKVIKSVNDKRISVKNECLKPYLSFEEKAKELIDIINQPINVLDNQVKEFEENQRLERIDEIRKYFAEVIRELEEDVSLDSIYDGKWENATVIMKSVKEDIAAKLQNIRSGIQLIKSMKSDKEDQALDILFDTLDVTKSIVLINQYEQQKREIQTRLEEQQRREKEVAAESERLAREREFERERERVREDERAKIAKEQQIREEERSKALAEQQAKEQAEREAMTIQKQANITKTIIMNYRISARKEELEQIEMYLQSIGVDYERID